MTAFQLLLISGWVSVSKFYNINIFQNLIFQTPEFLPKEFDRGIYIQLIFPVFS